MAKEKKVWIALYTLFAKNLPTSDHSRFAKGLRAFFGRRILSSAGKKIIIDVNGTRNKSEVTNLGCNYWRL